MTVTGPGFSVVVPAFERVHGLQRCLAALAAQQDVPGGLEVVVSIDGEDPAPAQVEMIAPADLDLHVLGSPRTGPAGARNRGAAVATGPLIAFVDDDCEPGPHWAAAMVAALERQPDAVVGGPVVNAHPRDACAAAAHAVLDALYATPPHQFLATANLALSRERFIALAGLDERFPTAAAEDRDFCARAHEAGMPVVLIQEAGVRHHRPSGVRHLWRQYVGYGRGARRLARQRANIGLQPVRAGRGFPRALAQSTLSAAREAGSPWVVAMVGLTQLATVWGYVTPER